MLGSLGLLLALFLLAAAWTFYIALYRLCFHPLAIFPGPKIAALTKWYEAWYDLVKSPGGQYFRKIDQMHETYGPIVRINPEEIHIKDPSWYDNLYTGSSGGIRHKYPPAAHMVGTPLGVFGTVDHHAHRLRRSLVSPLFSKRTIGLETEMTYDHAHKLADVLLERSHLSGHVELRASSLAWSTDVVCSYALGFSLDLLGDWPRAVEWRKNISALASLTPYAKQFPWLIPLALQLPDWILNALLPQIARVVWIHRYIHRRAADSIAAFEAKALPPPSFKSEAGSKPDFSLFRTILYSDAPPFEKEQKRMAQEGFVLLGAGGDTSSRTLTNTLYHILANRQSVLIPLMEELRPLFPSAIARPPLRDLEQLPFLTAVIKESLRLTSLITSRLPLVNPNQALVFQNWVIPAGTAVSMSHRHISQDPGLFPNANVFDPSRWLPGHPDAERNNAAFVPFGRGTRMCVGMNLALSEMYITISVVLQRLDLQLFDVSRSRDIDFERDCFVGEPSLVSPGVRVVASERREVVHEQCA